MNDNRTSNPRVKPCPFCGSSKCATVQDAQGRWSVQCADCLACGPRLSNVDGVAVEDWNDRTAVETSGSGLTEVRDRTANVALTCSGACRYRNGAFIADPSCGTTHGPQVKASESSGPIVVREYFCSHCKRNYGRHLPDCPFNAGATVVIRHAPPG